MTLGSISASRFWMDWLVLQGKGTDYLKLSNAIFLFQQR